MFSARMCGTPCAVRTISTCVQSSVTARGVGRCADVGRTARSSELPPNTVVDAASVRAARGSRSLLAMLDGHCRATGSSTIGPPMKQFSRLSAISASFYSPDVYRDVVSRWKGYGVLYLLLLLAICWLPSA